MAHLTVKVKESIILKAIKRGSENLESIAKKNNVGRSTLQRWIKEYKQEDRLASSKKSQKGLEFSSEEQFNHVLATYNLDKLSLGEYCRKNGLYSYQIKEWRNKIMSNKQQVKDKKEQQKLKSLQEENKKLKSDLQRKEKALAEASALLVMKKKADLIWGEVEVD